MKSVSKVISWFSPTFLAVCPACYWAWLVTFYGQTTLIMTYGKILSPLVVVLLIISTGSFYLRYRLYHNKIPFILSILGTIFYIYGNFINPMHYLFQFAGMFTLGIAALFDFNLGFNIKKKTT